MHKSLRTKIEMWATGITMVRCINTKRHLAQTQPTQNLLHILLHTYSTPHLIAIDLTSPGGGMENHSHILQMNHWKHGTKGFACFAPKPEDMTHSPQATSIFCVPGGEKDLLHFCHFCHLVYPVSVTLNYKTSLNTGLAFYYFCRLASAFICNTIF